jgi:hypothetical protein
MYPKPEEKSGAFALFQYVGAVAPSLNSVPPTAMLYGVDAAPFTANPWVAAIPAAALSQPAAPLSPAATSTVMPSAAACCHKAL